MARRYKPFARLARAAFRFLPAVAVAVLAGCARLSPPPTHTAALTLTATPRPRITVTPSPSRTPEPLELGSVGEHPMKCMDPPTGLPSQGVTVLSRLSAGFCFYGEIALFETAGRLYAALTVVQNQGNSLATFMISDVTDPMQPALVGAWRWNFATYSADVKTFRQGDQVYLAIGRDPYPAPARGLCDRTGGVAIVAVTEPEAPRLVRVLTGYNTKADRPWCRAHTVEVSEDGDGNGAFLYVSAVDQFYLSVLDIRNLEAVTEKGKYVHPDAGFHNPRNDFFVHDTTLEGNRVYVSYWSAGVVILDRERLEAGRVVRPLNPLDSIDPWGLQIHHAYPALDGQYLFVEDEVNFDTGRSQLRLYDIRDVKAPKEIAEISLVSPWASPHNLLVAGDRLYVSWYQEGIRIYKFDLSDPEHPLIEPYAHQAVRAARTMNPEISDYWDGIWGLRLHPCEIAGRSANCIYASDLAFGLMILEDAP